MSWILRPAGVDDSGSIKYDYVWDGNGTPTQSDYAQGYALANQAYQSQTANIDMGGGLMSRLNPDGTPRTPSSGGFLGAMGGGDILTAAAMAAGAYGLGNSGLLPSDVVGTTASGSFPPGSFNVAQAGMPDVPQGLFNGAITSSNPAGLTGPLQGTVSYGAGADSAIPFDFSGGGLGGLGGVLSGAGSLGGLLTNGALLGGLAGGALGGLGGGQKPAGSITTIQDVPDWLKPYVMGNLNAGMSAVNNASQYSSLLPGAQRQLASTINGDYLNPNTNPALAPYLKDLAGQTGSYFTGMYGGPAGQNINNSGFQEALARGVTGALAGPELQAYNTERTNQLNAASGAPGFAGQASQATFGPLTSFGGLIPNASSTSQPYFNNPTAGILGGALGGAVLGKGVFG